MIDFRNIQRWFLLQLATAYLGADVALVSAVRHMVIAVQVPNFVVQLLWFIQALPIQLVIAVSEVVKQVIAAHHMASMYRLYLD